MKTMKLMLCAVTVIAAASCAKEIAPENNQGNNTTPELNLIPMTFTAGAEKTGQPDSEPASDQVESRVLLQSDGKNLHWESTDRIKVFDGTETDLPAFTTTGSGASVDFTGGVSAETGTYYALYPYQADAKYGASTIASKNYGNVITATVPTEQIAVPNGIHSDAFIAAAKSDNGNGYFKFKTICGFIKFQLSEEDAANAVAVSISENNLASIAGNVEIYFTTDNGTTSAFGQDYVRGETKDYVTLIGSFQADTDYYFAIRSNKFESGFTMTIRYADGSSKYVTTTQPAPQNVSRNMIMNIGKPVFKPGLPNDLYIAWLHGLDIDIAGTKYNKEQNGSATHIKAETNISKAGVYIVDPGFTATVTSNINSIILVGRNPENRATIAVSKAFNPTGSNPMAIANADVTYANTNQLFNLAADTDVITFENCRFNNIQHTFINGSNNYKANSISIEDCEIQIVGSNNGSVYMYYTKNVNEHSLLNIENCIFYYRQGEGKTALTDFKVCQYGGTTIKDINVVRNTFDKTVIPNAGLVKAGKISGNLNINNNLFNDVVINGTNSNIIGLDTKTGEILPTGGNITYNFYYKSDELITSTFTINRTGLDNVTKGSPALTLGPILGNTWNPENGDYSTVESIQYKNNNDETITVNIANVGAKR